MATKAKATKAAAAVESIKPSGPRVIEIDPRKLIPNPANRPVRTDEKEFPILVTSVREMGVRDPVIVVEVEPGIYQISAGHRRTAAAVRAIAQDTELQAKVPGSPDSKCLTIPAIVVASDWGDEVGAVADLHHRALSTGEQIRLYTALRGKGWTDAKIGFACGLSRASVNNYIGIEKKLCPELRDLLGKWDTLPFGKLLSVSGKAKEDQVKEWSKFAGVRQPAKSDKADDAPARERGTRAAKIILQISVRADGTVEGFRRVRDNGGREGHEESEPKYGDPVAITSIAAWTVECEQVGKFVRLTAERPIGK